MDKEKVMRAIEHFDTERKKTIFGISNSYQTDIKAFEAILKLEDAEHLLFFLGDLGAYNRYKNAVALLWDITEEERETKAWHRFIFADFSRGKNVSKNIRLFLRDIKVELSGRGWYE